LALALFQKARRSNPICRLLMLLRSDASALVRLLVLMIRPRDSTISRLISRSSSSKSSTIA
jgi:hypothetical protein